MYFKETFFHTVPAWGDSRQCPVGCVASGDSEPQDPSGATTEPRRYRAQAAPTPWWPKGPEAPQGGCWRENPPQVSVPRPGFHLQLPPKDWG